MEYISGEGKYYSKMPPEIKGWNWGAFFLPPFWGIANKTYIALICFIPFVTPIMAFVLGAKGNEWSWKNKKWLSVEYFKKSQRNWALAGFIIFIFIVVITILGLFI